MNARDLLGADPNFTGGMDSVRFIRHGRGQCGEVPCALCLLEREKARADAAEQEVARLSTEPMAAHESALRDENDRLRNERNDWMRDTERLRAELSSYRAFTCSCGHPRTSHTPADFADCTECPHGTCSNANPGLRWDIWHRDTMRERDEARAAIARVRDVLDWHSTKDFDLDFLLNAQFHHLLVAIRRALDTPEPTP